VFKASLTTLVPKRHFTRASGLLDVSDGLSQLVAPAIAGLLMTRGGLVMVVLVDIVTCSYAVISLAVLKFPKVKPIAAGKTKRSWMQEAIVGWNFIKDNPPLIGLMVVFIINNFTSSFIFELVPPLVLSFSDVETLGFVSSVSGFGYLIGGVCVSVWGCFQPYSRTIFVLLGLQGGIMLTGRMEPSAFIIGLTGWTYLFLDPFINACSQSIWQSKVPLNIQGRVFALKKAVSLSSTPLGALLAGPLADHLTHMLSHSNSAGIAASMGVILAEGDGKGPRLMFVLLGFLLVFSSIVVYMFPAFHMQEFDKYLLDCVPGDIADVTVEDQQHSRSTKKRTNRNKEDCS